MIFGIGVVYRTLFSMCEFHADWLSNTHTLLVDIKELISLLSTFPEPYG
jgi:hypothetical protein